MKRIVVVMAGVTTACIILSSLADTNSKSGVKLYDSVCSTCHQGQGPLGNIYGASKNVVQKPEPKTLEAYQVHAKSNCERVKLSQKIKGIDLSCNNYDINAAIHYILSRKNK